MTSTTSPFASLRLSQNFGQSLGVKKVLTTVPVGKPSKDRFFRTHQSPDWVYPTFVLEDKVVGETYLVSEEVASALGSLVRPVELYVVIDRQGNLFVSGGGSGIVYRVGPNGGAAQPAAQIERNVRTLPDDKTQQAIVANGVEFDAAGVLHVTDTSRGAVWKVVIGADGKGGKPVLLAQSPLLEGADGLAFDRRGNAWVAANELNAIVSVSPSGEVKTIAQNGSRGPLEFPAALVFVGDTAYVANFDTPRRVNTDAEGGTARDGIGASIAKISR